MGLSYDLISEFVKITNDKKETTKEGTVYATVIGGTDGKYVRIDGSDLLTPMDTTTDIEDGERVTLMIKDHKAIVTGNVTTPSASTTKVDRVTASIDSVSDRVGTFELVVADKVSTNELEAYKATIEVLIANKATIEDLTATNAKIENLEVKNAEIENLVAEKATITDLEAVNATIENLKAKDAEIENAVVENLKATTADIKILNADFAQIKTLVNGNLTSDNILSFNLTSGKVTVDDAFIKDAMIDTVSAGKINAGEINTNLVSIGSEDGGMLITGSTQQFTDKNGNVRIQIGKDASGDFTFVLYDEDGKGQLINQNGITASAISDGLIVNDMVSDHAAISGGKLDISSVITEINSDNSTTIKSSKIYLNDQAQSLEVAFNSLKTQVDTIQEVTIKGDLTAIVEQVQSNTSKIEANKNSINTLISEDTVIKKQVTDLQGTLSETETTLNSKYTSLNQNLDGFKTTVADTYATKKSVTDMVDNIESNYSTTSVMNSAIEQKAQEISASVSSTYATKNQVNTLDNNLKSNYSTTHQMESAINVAKEAINLGVSSIYETKENSTSKIQNAVNAVQIGGTNLWVLLDLKTGCEQNGNIIGTSVQHKTRQTLIPTNGSRQLVYQCWNPNKVSNSSNNNRVAFFDSSKTYISSSRVLMLNGQTYQWQIINIPENTAYVRLGAICGPADKYDTTIKIKFEFGNKPTDYSLAPEDVINDISTAKTEAITSANNTLTSTISNYYTKSQTDSQINIAKEAINLGVSTNYETKANVQTKVTSTLNSAKSYADTKKSEAISTAASDATSKANTAKQEAIKSANNTLNSTIKNYYTKEQTDSQIEIAKDAINLGVSTTYETKANVTSKVASTLKSSKSYADTKKSEAISTAASDATTKANTAKQEAIKSANNTLNSTISNYYTKSQTDSQINIAKEAINLGVSTNYETKKNVESKVQNVISTVNNIKIGGRNLILNSKTNLLDNSDNDNWGCSVIENDYVKITPKNDGNVYTLTLFTSKNRIKGETYTLSFDILTPTKIGFYWYPSENYTKLDYINANDKWQRVSFTYTQSNDDKASTVSPLFGLNNLIKGKVYKYKNLKLEIGNKATDWIPAPEDIQSEISTAKSEAITSANNTLTSTISNYYTKTQTDSQINVAKEAINLGVSSTYETKANVTTKINNIQIGGRNLFKGYGESEITLNTYQDKGSFTQFYDCLTFDPADYVGKQFTISFYAKSPNGTTKLRAYNTNGDPRYFVFHASLDDSLGNAWKYYTFTFTNNDKGTSHSSYESKKIEIYAENKTGVLVKKIKIELGNKATDWTPAPEDIQSEISTIESETKTIKAAVTSLQLGSDSISASVKSLEQSMVNTTNGLASDISKVQDQVNLAMTSADVKLEIQKEMSKGANKVSTSTGFTFDQNGLNISKTDSEMKTQITEDGMKIYKNSDVMLTANNQGVDAKNLHATTYLIIGNNSRMEDITENGSKRTAVFWIG